MKLNFLSIPAAAISILPTWSGAQQIQSTRLGAKPFARRTQDASLSTLMVEETAYLTLPVAAKTGNALAKSSKALAKSGKALKAQSFVDLMEMTSAVSLWKSQGCSSDPSCEVGQTYGWPMNTWDVSQVDDFHNLFEYYFEFNEVIYS